MIHNNEIFYRNPTTFTIPNDGVAEVYSPQSPEQWQVLRYELESFVCEGEYREGLERILRTYLGHLEREKQPAVWVSGFYGSGKSHLVRVLEYLWRNVEFPDGAHARSLVQLPAELKALLTELSTASRRHGGLWSAAGSLGAGGDSVRLSLLALLFQSAGLPTHYAHARFIIWLKQQGIFDKVKAQVEAQGKNFDYEVGNLYVSPSLAKSVQLAYPELGGTASEVLNLLKAQFADQTEIDDNQFLSTMDDVLRLQTTTAGKRPCTLLVLDELQVFINNDAEITRQVQNIVEACSSRFGSQVLFVGTGQAALEAGTQISKLQDRFTVRVMLEDKDVTRVVREVILRKASNFVNPLQNILNSASGEIDRHLLGSKIAATFGDKADLVPDYPLLPTRRRFWERVLRSVDSAGTSGQLRNQLRMAHEATRRVALKPLGTVIGADFVYEQQESTMLQRKVLLPELAARIAELRDGTEEGILRSRLCATLFLIGELHTQGVMAAGLRATADTLADLLIEDLPAGSTTLRQRIPSLLADLVESGTLMQVDGEYRMQTREGAEWDKNYRARYARIINDETRLASDRLSYLQKAISKALQGIKLLHGSSKTPRKFSLEFGSDAPSTSGSSVPVWVRDEWSVSAKTVRDEAQAAGVESPLVFVLLPRQDADALKIALASHAAATETLNARPASADLSEAIVARGAMETRQRSEALRLEGLVAAILNSAHVYQGGGNEVVGENLSDIIKTAVEAALVRLFPQFSLADDANWGMAVKRAGQGAVDALTALGYSGDVDQHPVCKEVRLFVGAHQRGTDVLSHFRGVGYGWPDDAIVGALLALLAGGFIRAQKNHQSLTPKEIVQSQIGVLDFYGEGVTVTALQRIKVKTLFSDLGLAVKAGEEAAAIPRFLQQLLDLAQAAGGEAPLPPTPDSTLIQKLSNESGNAQFVAIFEARDELAACFKLWQQASTRKLERLPRWQLLQRLLVHADKLVVAAKVKPQVTAIVQDRSLLHDLDPVKPLIQELSSELRQALQMARQYLIDVRERELKSVEVTEEWQKLPDTTWQKILQMRGLGPVPELQVATEDALLTTLDAKPLAAWRDSAEVVPTRMRGAREEAAKLLEPQAVRVRPKSTTLRTADEVNAYVEGLRSEIMQQIEQGNPVIL